MEEVIKQTRIGKADGENKLPKNYQLQRAENETVSLDLFRKVWKKETIPKDWETKYNYNHP